jgi:hypothetical protein
MMKRRIPSRFWFWSWLRLNSTVFPFSESIIDDTNTNDTNDADVEANMASLIKRYVICTKQSMCNAGDRQYLL